MKRKNNVCFIENCGAFDTSLDFIDVSKKVISSVINISDSFGVLICGSGGMSIAANRYPKITAALCHSSKEAMLARQKSDSNVLCLSGDTIDTKIAIETLRHLLQQIFFRKERS